MPPSSLAGASGVMEMGECTWGSGDTGREGNRRAPADVTAVVPAIKGTHCFFDFSLILVPTLTYFNYDYVSSFTQLSSHTIMLHVL